MKKYIALTTLITAGALCANAETFTVFNIGGSSNQRAAWMDTSHGWTNLQFSDNGEQTKTATKDSLTLTVAGNANLAAVGPAGSFTANNGSTNPYPISAELKALSKAVFGNSNYDNLGAELQMLGIKQKGQ